MTIAAHSMFRMLRVSSALGAALALAACSVPPPSTTPHGDEWEGPQGTWQEVWRDDFDGPAGSAPNSANWNVEYRETGHNREKDFNTDRRDNSFLDGAGNLVIRALAENFVKPDGSVSTQPYTSARLNTQGKVEQLYGRIEGRIKLPPGGRGIWPAFWMLGNDIDDIGWPECGEVDILEMAGSEPFRVDGSLHGPGYSGGSAYTRPFDLPSGHFGDDYHVFAVEWTAEGIRWLVDENVYHVRTVEGMAKNGTRWVYDHPFFIIINLAIGGMYDGDPNASTVFPQEMLFDYISISELR